MSEIVAVLKDSPEGQKRMAEQARRPVPAEVKPGEKVDDVAKGEAETEPPLSIYEKLNGKPYTADYFEVPGWDLLDDETDIDGMRDKARFVEKWVKERIREERLEDSLDSYRQVISRYMVILNVAPTEKCESKFERISTYLSLLNKQKRLDLQKKMVINKCQVSPEDVTSEEYFEYLKSLGLTKRKAS